jgi:mRNA interferase HigB
VRCNRYQNANQSFDWRRQGESCARHPVCEPLPNLQRLLAPTTGACYEVVWLRIFNRATLVAFWTKHEDAEGPLRLWFSMVERANWTGPSELRAVFGSADFLADNRVVFDIKGNRYRIVAQIKYAPLCLVYIRFIGTHADYNEINARKV